MSEEPPDPTRVVADADVLAADLLVGDAARDALDVIRSHSWFTLVTTEALLDDAAAVITTLTSNTLAADWRARVAEEALVVDPVSDGHPALVAAQASEAATVLSLDAHLQRPETGAAIRPHLATSVKSPDSFVHLVDPASLYEAVMDASYPGPDRNPRG